MELSGYLTGLKKRESWNPATGLSERDMTTITVSYTHLDVYKRQVEDYVNTYLKRLYPTGGQDLRVGILLGSTETYEGVPYIFIDGALEMEDVTAAGEKVIFSEAAWKKAYQSIEETFPKRTVQGWFICGAPGCILSPLNYWKQHTQYFGGKNQLIDVYKRQPLHHRAAAVDTEGGRKQGTPELHSGNPSGYAEASYRLSILSPLRICHAHLP